MTLALERAGVVDQIIEAGGEVTAEQEAAILANLDKIEDKIEAYLAVIDVVEAQQEYAKEQARMASNWAGSCGNLIENLRARMAAALKIADIEKVKAGFRTVSRTVSDPKLVIENPDDLPLEYVRSEFETIEKVVILKDEIAAAIAAGTPVTGAKMSEPKDGIRITKSKDKKEKANV
jgi:hypothetical protein